MTFVIISFCAFVASFLTLFSGFGLGTLLMPVIAIFFPVPVAISVTAIVHMLNNVFKFILLKKNVKWKITLLFGCPAILAAFIGALLLSYLSDLPIIFTYKIFNITATVHPIKIIVGALLIIIATVELAGSQENINIGSHKLLPLGGLVSGFFGGLSGMQGAFRSTFLLHAGLNKEEFVSTNVSIAILVDLARLSVYGTFFAGYFMKEITLILDATFFAFMGAFIGVVYLKKVTLKLIQNVVVMLLYLLSTLLIFGFI